MSGGFPLGGSICNGSSQGLDSPIIHGGTAVAAGGVANTKGSWVQLVASTPSDTSLLIVRMIGDNSADININNYSLDIGIGAGGSETAIVSDLHSENSPGFIQYTFIIPICISAGSRISARAAADAGTLNTNYISIQLFDGSFENDGYAGVDAIGFSSGTTAPTTITSSMGVSGVKGTYVQLTASASKDYAGICLEVVYRGAAGQALSFDLAIGAGGSEIIVIPDYFIFSASPVSVRAFLPIEIPAGTRIAVRGCTSAGTASATLVMAYGLHR